MSTVVATIRRISSPVRGPGAMRLQANSAVSSAQAVPARAATHLGRVAAVERVAALAGETGVRAHILHVSSALCL
ncbi:hypothetical protein, partial [Streptosporangium sp. NPDC048865]|uniref:hypothetical protein n=1 Tax=Streptosporangium sp. NPDC048865 TaxID=3155766 RepID=UPI003430BFB6